MRLSNTAFILVVVLGCFCCSSVRAQPVDVDKAPDADSQFETLELGDGSLGDELLLFQDIPEVISASRQATPIHVSSASVGVLTATDIHAMGITDIDELLSFVPGIDALVIDRNRRALGVHGLHDFISDRTLTLIDGRNANSVTQGAGEIYRLPLLVEDIKSIEVTHGPGGASWGANAFNGVINIRMKDPEQTQGWFASSNVNEFGDTYQQLRWGGQQDDWAWRISSGYTDTESSSDALVGESFTSQDWMRQWRLDSVAARQLQQGRLELGLAYGFLERGPSEFLGTSVAGLDRDIDQRTARAYARYEREFSEGVSGYLQWFGNYASDDITRLYKVWSVENDFETQLDWSWRDDHAISAGGNLRLINYDTQGDGLDYFVVDGGARHEEWIGAFLIDRYRVNDRLTLEGQGRVDYYSGTSLDWSGRLSALVPLDDAEVHVVRASLAKAFRAPLPLLREASALRMPLASPPAPAGTFGVNVLEPQGVSNEQIYSGELGYSGTVGERLKLRVGSYWQRYEELLGARSLPDPLSLGRAFFQVDNLAGAIAYGADVESSIEWGGVETTLWYSYNDFNSDRRQQEVRAFRPSRHKAGARIQVPLPWEFGLYVGYRYSTTTQGGSEATSTYFVPAYHRIDLTLRRGFAEKGEFLIGVRDLLDELDELGARGFGAFTQHETPGMTVFARVQFGF